MLDRVVSSHPLAPRLRQLPRTGVLSSEAFRVPGGGRGMTANAGRSRKPFTMRQRRAWPQHDFGWRPTTNWGSGDLPAPWAAGDVVRLIGESHERLDGMPGPYYVVDTAFSISEDDAWYFRVADGTRFGEHVQSSGRLHVIPPDTDWMSCFELVETADPEGLALRERMLADGWSYAPPPTCEACGQRLPPDSMNRSTTP